MKTAFDILKAVLIVVLLVSAMLAVPFMAIIIGFSLTVGVIYLIVQDHKEYLKSEKDRED